MSDQHPRIVATPLARRRAKRLAVSLEYVRGSGPGGRITSQDVTRSERPVLAVGKYQQTLDKDPAFSSEWSRGLRLRLAARIQPPRNRQLMTRSTTVDVTRIYDRWIDTDSNLNWTDFVAGALISTITRSSCLAQLTVKDNLNPADLPPPLVGITVETSRGPVVGAMDPRPDVTTPDAVAEVKELVSRLRKGSAHLAELRAPLLIIHADKSSNELETPLMLAGSTPTLWIGNTRRETRGYGADIEVYRLMTMRLSYYLVETGDITASNLLDTIAGHLSVK